jgi:bifunctional non-homologous end joining protein LigD
MGTGPLPLVRPMLATLGPLPRAPGWGYELKWDGVRAVAYLDKGRLRLMSRNDRDITVSYPELAELLEALPRGRLILDGEIVALGSDGAPSFGLLQQRMHVVTPSQVLLSRVPVRFYAFDVLHRGGRSLLDRPYTRRREELDALDLERSDVAQTPPSWTGDAGPEVMEAAKEQGLEGVVAKRLDSAYQPGRRSPAWVKTPLNRTQEVLLCGWKPGGGRRAGTLGSLLLGAHDGEGRLRYLGGVGTGFTQRMLGDLLDLLRPLARDTPPFDEPVPRPDARNAHWVEPGIVGEVEFRSWTPDRHLRHPSWRGLRPDRDPAEITLPAT